ncbi:MAG TPA: hypothetical protein VMF90_15030 [Rhizobiaceae bacterium]|nr:hypothetical protein [Rhizobiaceae bacterium]
MTITYPRQLPDYRLQEGTIRLEEGVTYAGSGRNRGPVMNRTRTIEPAWRGRFGTIILERNPKMIWSAWGKSLKGGMKTFVAWDIERPTPIAYPDAAAPEDIESGWNGTATVTSLGLSGALGLSGLPANYQLKAGDRIGLRQTTRYGYYEVLEDVTANGSGVVTVTVTPFLHTTVFTTAAVAWLWRPVCLFVIDWQTWTEQTLVKPTPISFEANQTIEAV